MRLSQFAPAVFAGVAVAFSGVCVGAPAIEPVSQSRLITASAQGSTLMFPPVILPLVTQSYSAPSFAPPAVTQVTAASAGLYSASTTARHASSLTPSLVSGNGTVSTSLRPGRYDYGGATTGRAAARFEYVFDVADETDYRLRGNAYVLGNLPVETSALTNPTWAIISHTRTAFIRLAHADGTVIRERLSPASGVLPQFDVQGRLSAGRYRLSGEASFDATVQGYSNGPGPEATSIATFQLEFSATVLPPPSAVAFAAVGILWATKRRRART